MSEPTVSIITPSFNQADYIEDTLQSVKTQDYDNIGHIVIDGKSNDGTVEILESYEDTYDMEWVSEKDKGQADAINKGFKKANGEILAWLNSDDVYISKHTVSKAVNTLKEYPGADIVNGRGIRLQEDGKWDHPIKRRNHKLSHSGLKQLASVLQPATFWYSYVWQDIGINSDLEYTFDWDFFIRATKRYNLIPISDFLAGYRWQGDNKTTHGGIDRVREIRDTTGKYNGQNSWQYQLLCIYFGVYVLSAYLPDAAADRIRNGIDYLSNVISYLTLRQVSGV